MQLSGHISKMHTTINKGVAHYQLPIGDQQVALNSLVGQSIQLEFNGQIRCSNCNRVTNKSYSQGYCYPCCQNLARCDLCIMRPETCHYHLGTCREPQWGQDNCFAPHVVYLANSSGVKVGITRKTNLPSRWIDQGAVSALAILELDNRLKSGQVEVALKQFVSDKTNWRKMLKNEVDAVDLAPLKEDLLPRINNLITSLSAKVVNNHSLEISYPVLEYPTKISSLSFDKMSKIEGVLLGIKGQYLILDSGVLNIRKFSSYGINLTYGG